MRWPPDEHRISRDHRIRRNQRALPQNAPVSEPGARHEDCAVTDLAQVSNGGADDGGAVSEHRALPDPDRVFWRPYDDAVCEDGRVVADADVSTVRPNDQALRQDCPGADLYVAQERGRASDLRSGLVGQKLVEAHLPLLPGPWVARALTADLIGSIRLSPLPTVSNGAIVRCRLTHPAVVAPAPCPACRRHE